MQELEQLLSEVVRRTTFDVSTKCRREARVTKSDDRRGISYELHTKPIGQLSPSELQEIYSTNRWRSGEWGEALTIRPIYDDECARNLEAGMRSLLECYISSDGHIGHALPDSIEGPFYHRLSSNGFEATECVSSISDFHCYVVVAAAIVGVQPMVNYLCDWVAGKPLKYRTVGLIVGIRVDRPLILDEGITIRTLPISSTQLPQTLPGYGSLSADAYLDGVVLEVDSLAKPALYRPDQNSEGRWKFGQVIQHSWALKESSLDEFCESLSLASNTCVRCKQIWRDYGELTAYSDLSSKSSMPMRTAVASSTEVIMTIEQLKDAWQIHSNRIIPGEPQYLKTAIARWISSKQADSDIVDQFIDLRIALEALFLNRNHRGSQTLRVATHGALFLVQDYKDRRSHYDVLRETYELASNAVHTGRQNDTSMNRDLLTRAQNICRDGILKVIAKGTRPDWDNVMLGYPVDS